MFHCLQLLPTAAPARRWALSICELIKARKEADLKLDRIKEAEARLDASSAYVRR